MRSADHVLIVAFALALNLLGVAGAAAAGQRASIPVTKDTHDPATAGALADWGALAESMEGFVDSLAESLGMSGSRGSRWAPAEVSYEVSTWTRDVSEAGTDDSPTIQIIGTAGRTKPLTLDNPDRDDLNRAQLDRFYFEGASDRVGNVGYPIGIILKSGGADDWAFEKIQVAYLAGPMRGRAFGLMGVQRIATFTRSAALGDDGDAQAEHAFEADDVQTATTGTYKYLLSDTWEVFDLRNSPSAYPHSFGSEHTVTTESWQESLKRKQFASTTSISASFKRKFLGGEGKFSINQSFTHTEETQDTEGSRQGSSLKISRSGGVTIPKGYLVFFRVQTFATGQRERIENFAGNQGADMLASQVKIVTNVQPVGFVVFDDKTVKLTNKLVKVGDDNYEMRTVPSDTTLETTVYQKIYNHLDWRSLS